MRIACHQINFCPWFPFFYKMAMVDKFVLMENVQFEKNGYQNRYKLSNGKWITKPVNNGIELLKDKQYVDGNSLSLVNCYWIYAIKKTLGIETKLCHDYKTSLTATERLIDLVKNFGGDTYITNPEAKDKYLDEELMRKNGIEIEYCVVPRHLQIHTFEAFERFGIEGCIKQLPVKERQDALC